MFSSSLFPPLCPPRFCDLLAAHDPSAKKPSGAGSATGKPEASRLTTPSIMNYVTPKLRDKKKMADRRYDMWFSMNLRLHVMREVDGFKLFVGVRSPSSWK